MILNLGKVKPGSTIYIPFDTFDGGTGASITMSGLAVTDIEVYKDGGTTQRASDNGYTLLDTDGIDFDGLTGIHGFSISLADNSTAGFWAAGSRYFVVVSAITVDAQTVSFIAATFEIAIDGAVLDTTIATLASQTSFTLTAGPAEDDALNGCVCYIHDVASAVQGGFAIVSDYTGATKTVTLVAGTTFTAAATDNVSFFPRFDVGFFGGVAGTFAAGRPEVNTTHAAGTAWGSGAITAASIATGAIDADAVAADAVTEIQSGLATAAALDTIDNFLDTEIAAILADTNELQTDWADGGRLDLILDARASQTSVDTVDNFLDTEIAAILALLDDARGEPGQGTPPVNPDLATKIDYLYKAWRNRHTQTATEYALYADDGVTKDQEAAVSDDGVTFDRGEVATGA